MVDNLKDGTKFANLVDLDIADYCDKERFHCFYWAMNLAILMVFHEGMFCDATEWDGKYIMHNNYEYSLRVVALLHDREIPFSYASSAALWRYQSIP